MNQNFNLFAFNSVSDLPKEERKGRLAEVIDGEMKGIYEYTGVPNENPELGNWHLCKKNNVVRLNMHTILTRIKAAKKTISIIANNGTLACEAMIKFVDTNNFKRKEEIEKVCQSNFDYYNALIENIKALEEAKLEANAITLVEVNGEVKTVAQWLQRMSVLSLEASFLKEIGRQYDKETSAESKYLADTEALVNSHIANIQRERQQNGLVPLTDAEIESQKTFDRESRMSVLVDPNKLNDEVLRRREQLNTLMTDIDAALQTSNAVTTILVALAD